MIATIKPILNYKDVINYHEKKCKKGDAILLDNQTFSDTTKGYFESFEKTISLNKKVRDNKAVHISLNLPHNENLDDKKFKDVALYYLDKMGYSNTPYLIYRHYDKEHAHIHIVTTSIDFDGKKINEYNNHYRSNEVTREIESIFNLKATEINLKDKNKLQHSEIQQEKFAISNALRKAFIHHYAELQERGFQSIAQTVANVPLSNMEIKRSLGNERFSELSNFLSEKGLIKKNNKSLLIEKLKKVYENSSTKNEFFDNLKKENIYYRIVLNKKGNPYLIYGLKEKGFYIKENKLSDKYTLSSINRMKEVKYNQEYILTKRYISSRIKNSLYTARNFDEFKTALYKSGIEVKEHRNSSGIYGISFKSLKNNIEFKASDIHKSYSYLNIIKQLNKNENRVGEYAYEKTRDYLNSNNLSHYSGIAQVFDGGITKFDGYDDKHDENLKRKKKRRFGL
ncbi:MAG: relaxase/mobilization nuclease domain-containing protein [Bacteroidia bacterium]